MEYKLTSQDRADYLLSQLQNILQQSEEMARNEISDDTYYTNGKRSRDMKILRESKELFKHVIDKV
jgi:hypothetical protein